ncbi:MAG: type II secretion system protein J, partial [Candidatus Spyradenecus sp.]
MPHLFTLSHTLRPLRRLGRRGFSLIEVLVAMTILTVIVLIVAGIFQQTGLAWTLGLRRADAQAVTRAVVGAISRDLAMMVDPANFVIAPAEQDGSARESAYSAGSIDAADGAPSGSLDFWILRPADLSM